MSNDANASKPAGGSSSPRRSTPHTMMVVINGVLAGVGTLYVVTGSVAVTVIGAAVAVAAATMYLIAGS